jgi:hypothetical protein
MLFFVYLYLKRPTTCGRVSVIKALYCLFQHFFLLCRSLPTSHSARSQISKLLLHEYIYYTCNRWLDEGRDACPILQQEWRFCIRWVYLSIPSPHKRRVLSPTNIVARVTSDKALERWSRLKSLYATRPSVNFFDM